MTDSISIPQFPELTFDEFSHTYRLNELIIPSVTTVMKLPSSSASATAIRLRNMARSCSINIYHPCIIRRPTGTFKMALGA